MAEQIIKDRRNKKLGKIKSGLGSNINVYDAMNRKVGQIRKGIFGQLKAYNGIGKQIASFDERTGAIKNSTGKTVAKKATQMDFIIVCYFSE